MPPEPPVAGDTAVDEPQPGLDATEAPWQPTPAAAKPADAVQATPLVPTRPARQNGLRQAAQALLAAWDAWASADALDEHFAALRAALVGRPATSPSTIDRASRGIRSEPRCWPCLAVRKAPADRRSPRRWAGRRIPSAASWPVWPRRAWRSRSWSASARSGPTRPAPREATPFIALPMRPDHDRRRRCIRVSGPATSGRHHRCLHLWHARGDEGIAENVTSGRPPAMTPGERKRRQPQREQAASEPMCFISGGMARFHVAEGLGMEGWRSNEPSARVLRESDTVRAQMKQQNIRLIRLASLQFRSADVVETELRRCTNLSDSKRRTCSLLLPAKAEIDTIFARLAALSAEHFNCTPDEITWADVGTLGSYLERLREVSDAAFHEGEHAT